MDDFLHNLRSGKLKQPDRSGRSYNDPQYKGGPRRNVMDRRKRDYGNKESYERLEAIKEVLETLAETQKRMAEAYEARTQAEERKARAMEVLAQNLYRMINPEATDADALFSVPVPVPSSADVQTHGSDIPPSESEFGTRTDRLAQDAPDKDNTSSTRLSTTDRQKVVSITEKMRKEGNSWEHIARHIAAQGFPTLSGKGFWRGVMVKNLYEKVNAE